jgi:type II secretion system protein H
MRGRQAGFTLIEITVVVILLGLIVSTAIVRLDNGLPSTRSEAAARKLLSTLDLARTSAIAKAAPYEVVFDLKEQRYGIRLPFDEEGTRIADPEARPMLSWVEAGDGVVLKGLLDPTGQLIEDGSYVLAFDPQGAATDLTLYMGTIDNEDYELTVRLLALTGIASVFQGRIEPEILVENDF